MKFVSTLLNVIAAILLAAEFLLMPFPFEPIFFFEHGHVVPRLGFYILPAVIAFLLCAGNLLLIGRSAPSLSVGMVLLFLGLAVGEIYFGMYSNGVVSVLFHLEDAR